MKHTPGPWAWFLGDLVTVKADGSIPLNTKVILAADDYRVEVSDQNSRLIAAAPDLLAVLKRLSKRPADYFSADDWQDIEAAIGKATGGDE
jgi:hypothetical protein